LAGTVRALPARAVALTFDDGYADNLLHARPLLEQYKVPATAFVPTGRLEEGGEFWWDELGRVLLQPGHLPGSLHLEVGDSEHNWDLGEAATYTTAQARQYSMWKAWERAPTRRHALYCQMYDLLSGLEPAGQSAVMAQLRAWASVTGEARETYRSLTPDELRSLAQSDLVEIGAHTVTHANLAALPLQAQMREIAHGKARLETIIGRPVDGFAYPFGRQCDYTKQTVAQVRAGGFTYACSNVAGLVTPATDRFQFPRMQVHDWDGAEFARRLKWWLGW
jgi:peptidoglycan/xylan/chitin deacetylase (PgdA/CDA1 family)